MASLLATTVNGDLTLTNGKLIQSSGIKIGNVSTTASSTGISIGNSASASGTNGIAIGVGATNSAGNSVALGGSAANSGENRITLPDSWQVYNSGGIITTSDRNEKTDITSIESSCTDFLMSLSPVTFKYNYRSSYPVDNPDPEYLRKYGIPEYDKEAHAAAGKAHLRDHLGFIAQDIEDKLEEFGLSFDLVSKDGIDTGMSPEEGYERYYLNYIGFIPILVKVIQEQETYIKSLEARIKALEEK